MNTYIAFLRGINVSGQKKVPMAELRGILKDSGYEDINTYIQTGNIVLRTLKTDITLIKENMENVIKVHFGFEVPVLLKTPMEIENLIGQYPFEPFKLESSYFTLLHKQPDDELLAKLLDIKLENEEFKVIGDCVYFYSETGYGKAKANNNFFEKKLKVTATTRNYKTMKKLLTLSS